MILFLFLFTCLFFFSKGILSVEGKTRSMEVKTEGREIFRNLSNLKVRVHVHVHYMQFKISLSLLSPLFLPPSLPLSSLSVITSQGWVVVITLQLYLLPYPVLPVIISSYGSTRDPEWKRQIFF